MQITTVGKDRYSAVFNNRSLSITNEGQVKAVDTSTGEVMDGETPFDADGELVLESECKAIPREQEKPE